MKNSEKFPKFVSWAEGYCALSFSMKDKDRIVDYIKNQKEHHKVRKFEDELKTMLYEYGIEYDEKFLFAD